MKNTCFYIFFLVTLISYLNTRAQQQLQDLDDDEPFNLKNFHSDYIRLKKVKTVTIKFGTKVPGQKIIDKPLRYRLYFDKQGNLSQQLTLISIPGLNTDSAESNYYYSAGKIAWEEIKTANTTEIIRYSYEGQKEEILREKRNLSDQIVKQSIMLYDRSVVQSGKQTTRLFHNDKLAYTFTDYFDSNEKLLEHQEVQHPHNYKTVSKYKYTDNRIEQLNLNEFGVETIYTVDYNPQKLISKITEKRSGKELQTLEYFYYKNLLETALRVKSDSPEVEIINYSYEFY